MDNRPVRILVDTNVALDLLLNREPFAIDALQLFALAEAEKVELLLSTDAIDIRIVLCGSEELRL